MVIFSVSKLNFEIKSSPGKKNIHVNLGPAHTTPRGVGLMAWAIRRSVFSSHAIWPNYLNTLRLMAWKHAIWPDYLNTLRLMAWKHAIWPTFLYSNIDPPGRGSYLPISFPSGKDSGGYSRDEVEWIIS